MNNLAPIPGTEELITKEASMPHMDLSAVGNAIITGGADIIFNRFNAGVSLEPREAKDQVINGLARMGAYFHQLEQLSDPEHFGVYFEFFSPKEKKKGSKLLAGGNAQAATVQSTPETGLTRIVEDSSQKVRLIKVPDRYELLCDPKYNALRLAWRIRESVRKGISPEPICRGVIVIDKYVYNDQFNLRGNSVINYAIAAREDYIDMFAKLATLNSFVNAFKMFDTSFLVEDNKPISSSMKKESLKSLRGHARSIGYSFTLKEHSPIEAYAALAKELGYKPCGFAAVSDPIFPGILTNGSKWFDLDNMPRTIPGMGGIQLVGEKGNQIGLSNDEPNKDTYYFSLSDLACDTAAEFTARFTSAIGRLGAVTGKRASYKNMFDDNNSVYLPGFPMANINTLSLSYPGDLSPLYKEERRKR
jgi:hypothetical protein